MSSNRHYKRQVALAKKYVQEYLENKWKICKIACDVCTVKIGGHLNKKKDEISIGQFAEDIGVSRKTLSEWVLDYRRVYVKLTDKQKEALSNGEIRIIQRIVKDSQSENVLNLAIIDYKKNYHSYLLNKRTKLLATCANYFGKLNYSQLTKEQVEGIKRLAKRILK